MTAERPRIPGCSPPIPARYRTLVLLAARPHPRSGPLDRAHSARCPHDDFAHPAPRALGGSTYERSEPQNCHRFCSRRLCFLVEQLRESETPSDAGNAVRIRRRSPKETLEAFGHGQDRHRGLSPHERLSPLRKRQSRVAHDLKMAFDDTCSDAAARRGAVRRGGQGSRRPDPLPTIISPDTPVTRQMTLPTSSAISRAPWRSKTTPTGRP